MSNKSLVGVNLTTDWASGELVVAAKELLKVKRHCDDLGETLRKIVDCGGIGPESMFNDAREALIKYEEYRYLGFKRETYTGQYGPFDYLIIPRKEYSNELVAKVHSLPFLLSEWRGFYDSRFARVNGVNGSHEVKGDFVKLPIITEKECWDLGL